MSDSPYRSKTGWRMLIFSSPAEGICFYAVLAVLLGIVQLISPITWGLFNFALGLGWMMSASIAGIHFVTLYFSPLSENS